MTFLSPLTGPSSVRPFHFSVRRNYRVGMGENFATSNSFCPIAAMLVTNGAFGDEGGRSAMNGNTARGS